MDPQNSKLPKLNNPWLIAVWPGMGNVAISAGYYLMAKLEMHLLAEFSARELFEVNHIDVKDGKVRAPRLPRSRLFVWKDPEGRRDIIVFLGEAQPPVGKYAFCRRLIDFARELGVHRVFTFAAMATQMRPDGDSRVFGAAIDDDSLAELRELETEILEEARISGLNGVLLAAAAESGLQGCCLLGEMPGVFSQLPFPKGSLAVLDTFAMMAQIDIDTTELAQQAEAIEERLTDIYHQMEQAIEQQMSGPEEHEHGPPHHVEPPEETKTDKQDLQRIETLFDQAKQDRSKAYELKRELDRLNLFADYEDRFLDLFKEPGS